MILLTGFFVFLCANSPFQSGDGPAFRGNDGIKAIFLSLLPGESESAVSENSLPEGTVLCVNGTKICIVDSKEEEEALLVLGRRALLQRQGGSMQQTDTLLFRQEVSEEPAGEDAGELPKKEAEIADRIADALLQGRITTQQRAYAVKVNELTFYLPDEASVLNLLGEAKAAYDTEDAFRIVLQQDSDRKLYAMTAEILPAQEEEADELLGESAGGGRMLGEITEAAGADAEIRLGLRDLDFGDTVEVAECYVTPEELTDYQEAVEAITQDRIREQTYEVQPGDTLSQIAEKNDTTVDQLVSINAQLEGDNPVIRAGDELTVTVPEPELSFIRVMEEYYEENFEGEVQYQDNDEWYTTKEVTLQEPVAGFHKVVADITYRNDQETGRDIKQETIVAEAVPKIVERGTIIAPTYQKPISGGRLSSGFGKRTAPKKGASTYHKGIDWATPIGTAVMASSGGVVSRAGWGSGYGNVVYIDHPDGRQTRYGHLSKVLVSVGQKVSQGEKIALSGNTGRSTGPHVHFEILIDGTQVNPLNYLE